MGQSASSAEISSRRSRNRSMALRLSMETIETEKSDNPRDYTSDLPDECLACVFQFLNPSDRKTCSLVCRRWKTLEEQSRHRLSLNAPYDLVRVIPSLFSRFDSVTKLALRCDRRDASIDDDALVLISLQCRNLTRLKLRACRELTDDGMAAFSKNCKGLKKLSCGSCAFGAKGMNAVFEHCSALEALSVKRLRGMADGDLELIKPGVAAESLRTLCLKELYNGQCFGPVIVGAKNLKTLKIFRCSGDWDKFLQEMADHAPGMVEIHLERIQVSDRALAAISKCSNLEILHLVKTPECTNFGLIPVAERCKRLRKLHIDGWKTNRIGDEGLMAVAKFCSNLQELVLIGVNPTRLSLGMLAANCQNLERLALCGTDTVGDPELSCIAIKCIALKKLCIKNCPVSEEGMEALVNGCPNLVQVRVKKCRGVTGECVDWLREARPTLSVNLDAVESEPQDTSTTSDGGLQDNGSELPFLPSQIIAPSIAANSTGSSESLKWRIGFFSLKNLVACALRWWSSGNGSSQPN